MSRFIILMYHMISEPQTAAEVRFACPPKQFEKHLQLLLKKGYTPVSINQVSNYYTQNIPLPDKAVLITLDDGFEDNYLNALPIFQRYHIPALIYLATGLIGKTNQWMTSPTFSERKILSWSQIKEMADYGIEFGSHTVSHPRLNELGDEKVEQELTVSKQTIEEHLGKECAHFAYPYGLLTESTRDLVKNTGFKTACSTRSGFNNAERDPLILHRIEVYGNDPTWKLNQKINFGTNEASLLFPLQYYANRLLTRLG
ncbi:MAG: polysaccharide deacetylase family protein [Methylococcaceae bacterium]|jgi:peptidoglycan/xylan/chitin deacetylase (PgdA/CDA1 family)|nr:polysaccharide deacetylase family protein [Methylococcales bacterium]MDD5112747.1 polysaccharide deacetylase family protein [Methylobacter sp.]MDO9161086.1 polysaccharide deacetylase family protein [Methylococcaceae bacterium]MDP2393706.1 polysaccharide deacetylase family protein [Methylococcaceae bacterium]MDP3019732.1 polysaccharide deacetylase family protein [Methylococcaceae bacterium]